jgi:hypothetical protein
MPAAPFALVIALLALLPSPLPAIGVATPAAGGAIMHGAVAFRSMAPPRAFLCSWASGLCSWESGLSP